MTTANAQNETIGTWKEHATPMRWSIYDRESWQAYATGSYDTREESIAAYRNIKLDLKAPEGVPNGIYTVVNHSIWDTVGEATGAEVRDGYFVPGPTARACFEALCNSDGVTPEDVKNGVSEVCHVFIEDFTYDPGTGKIVVGLGS